MTEPIEWRDATAPNPGTATFIDRDPDPVVDEIHRSMEQMANEDVSTDERIRRIETMVRATGEQVNWAVNQLGGMMQAAQNMPGIGGMMARKMMPNGGNEDAGR